MTSAAAATAAAAFMTSPKARAQEGPDVVGRDIPNDVLQLLDPGVEGFRMKAVLDRVIEFGSAFYYVIVQFQEDMGIGEPVIIKKPINGEAVILEDFVGLPQVPAPAGFNDAESVDLALFALAAEEATATRAPEPVTAAASQRQDTKVLTSAASSVNTLDSSTARGTNGGRLACAWAVNKVVERALGRPILSGPNGLATSNLVKVLRSKHVKVRTPVSGAIVISPTMYSPRVNVGHVGIVGSGNKIYSNSSNKKQWINNFTTDSWSNYYGSRKGLPVEYFRLDEIYFT
ncbi:hypothetical protein NKJ70_05900 [Mesorhizobium sp. M0092]|uniref:hypothetical protein n=1 Tax=Mesorhizobium sp. M0092 TaxID=2956876 RepID=UPI00333D410A